MSSFMSDYWPMIMTVAIVIMAFARLEVNVEILKEKVKTLFELWNQKKD